MGTANGAKMVADVILGGATYDVIRERANNLGERPGSVRGRAHM